MCGVVMPKYFYGFEKNVGRVIPKYFMGGLKLFGGYANKFCVWI